MDKIALIRILCFSLVPLGIYGFVWVYRIGKKIFAPAQIFELPFEQQTGTFRIEEKGTFAIWHKGRSMSYAPVDKYKPQLTNIDTGEIISLRRSLLRPKTSGFGDSSMTLFDFSAEAGNYKLEIVEGSSVSRFETILTSRIARTIASDFDPHNYWLLVKKRLPLWTFPLFILLIMASFYGALGGFIIGMLADQIFS